MAKVANQKVKLLFIADYIVRQSDDENGFYIKDGTRTAVFQKTRKMYDL